MKALQNIIITLLATAFIVLPAHAISLQDAKSQGLVGEMATGYLGSPKGQASSEAAALIKDINSKRKAKYMEIAKSQGISLEAVENLAGKKAFEKTAAGHYINVPGVGWKKK
ncbi:hypothetical protein SAMN02745866_01868 [Alteromonadaceae bacterium Bs31]|nr:hypothetical protein SAMN02745866_01868 [Alteromonadaceae bacterium Bs31]